MIIAIVHKFPCVCLCVGSHSVITQHDMINRHQYLQVGLPRLWVFRLCSPWPLTDSFPKVSLILQACFSLSALVIFFIQICHFKYGYTRGQASQFSHATHIFTKLPLILRLFLALFCLETRLSHETISFILFTIKEILLYTLLPWYKSVAELST